MKVAVLYEQSGRVRDAFAARGHEAISVDLREGHGAHVVCDALQFLRERADEFDRIIAHPTCTYVSGSGYHWNERTPGRAACTLYALDHARKLFSLLDAWVDSDHTNILNDGPPILRGYAVENPVGIMSTEIRPVSFTVQPYLFGDPESKRTCFWVRNLRKLRPTGNAPGRIVDDGRAQLGLFGTGVERFENQTDSGQNRLAPSHDRWSLRSETYPGIAAAMAAQWA